VIGTPHPPTVRRASICRVCRRRYLPPLGRPAQGRPAHTCDRCVTEARDHAIATEVDRVFAARMREHHATLHLTDADCWRDCALASAVEEDS